MDKIAIINLKGGVGKSVTACNLAAELAAKSKSVLVVDLDKQGNTSKFFGVLDYDSPSVAEVMLGEDDIQTAIVKGVDFLGVHLLPCDMRMLKANRTILMDNGPRQFHLRKALECVAGDYDYCIMDCPPDLDMGSINALCAADWVIIPVDCGEWAMDGLQEILKQVKEAKEAYDPALEVLCVLPTMYRRTRYGAKAINQLAESGLPLFRYEDGRILRIDASVKVQEAISEHMPLYAYSPKSKASEQYIELARHVVKKVEG